MILKIEDVIVREKQLRQAHAEMILYFPERNFDQKIKAFFSGKAFV